MAENISSSSGSDSSFRIRRATAADRERLIPLINSAFSVETFMQGPRTDQERLAASMEKGVILLAEELAVEDLGVEGGNGRLLASIYTELRGARGYAGMLAVDPAHQRSGLGRRMMEAAEAHLRRHSCEAVDITVLSLRPELPPLYRKFGFVETGTEEFAYPHPIKDGQECHCVVMSKKLAR
jgi:ribosomal protein S18 acetylase RimI-like enzyme